MNSAASERRFLLPFLLVAIVGMVVLNLVASARPTFLERFLASCLVLVSFIPAAQYVFRSERGIPFLPLLGWVYAVHYALPIFLLDSYDFQGWLFPHPIIERALFLSLAGFLLLLAAFTSSPWMGKIRILPPLSLVWDPYKVKRIAPLLGIVGLFATYYERTTPPLTTLQQLVGFVSGLSLLGILMLFSLQLKGELGFPMKLLLWAVLIPCQLILDLPTGAVYQVLKDVIPLMMLYWAIKRKVPWISLLLGFVFLILFRGNSLEFRFTAEDPIYEELSVPGRSFLFIRIVYENTRTQGVTDAYSRTLERMSHLITFADVIEQTPETVPYWRGETYATLFTGLIPRVLWPEKPAKEVGHIFGHRYGRLHPADEETSENLPQLVEMYANFGPIGVFLGMFLLGMVYRLLYVLLNHPDAGDGGLVIAAIIFTYLLSIETDFSLTFGAVIQYIVLFYLLLRPLRVRTA